MHYSDLGSEELFHLLSIFDSSQIPLNLVVYLLFFLVDGFLTVVFQPLFASAQMDYLVMVADLYYSNLS